MLVFSPRPAMWQFPVTVKFVWLDILRILLNVSTLFWYIAWEPKEIVELAEILAFLAWDFFSYSLRWVISFILHQHIYIISSSWCVHSIVNLCVMFSYQWTIIQKTQIDCFIYLYKMLPIHVRDRFCSYTAVFLLLHWN